MTLQKRVFGGSYLAHRCLGIKCCAYEAMKRMDLLYIRCIPVLLKRKKKAVAKCGSPNESVYVASTQSVGIVKRGRQSASTKQEQQHTSSNSSSSKTNSKQHSKQHSKQAAARNGRCVEAPPATIAHRATYIYISADPSNTATALQQQNMYLIEIRVVTLAERFR